MTSRCDRPRHPVHSRRGQPRLVGLLAVSLFAGVLASLPLPVRAEPFAWVTNQGADAVSVIDLATDAVVDMIKVGKAPAGVVASSPAGRVFVTNPESNEVSVIDMRSRAVIQTVTAGQSPVGIDVSADGRLLFVADWFGGRLLPFAITADRLSPLDPIEIGRVPAGVAATRDGRHVWVAERDDNRLALVDVAARSIIARIDVGEHPFAVLLDATRDRLYALNVLSNDVSVIDTRSRRLVATVPVGKAPYGAALADEGRRLFVTNQQGGTVSVIDADKLDVIQTIKGFDFPEGIAAWKDKVYVVNWMLDAVIVVGANDGKVGRRIDIGSNPRGFGAFIGAPVGP